MAQALPLPGCIYMSTIFTVHPLGLSISQHMHYQVISDLSTDLVLPNGLGVVYWSEGDCVSDDDVKEALAPFKNGLARGLFMFESTPVSNVYFNNVRNIVCKEFTNVQVLRVNDTLQARQLLHALSTSEPNSGNNYIY
ncbi:hypothetical protein SARC_04545 [Sphaeroforma arctica JP610]|uniref:Fanconi anemia core complex-associated protein 24 pseudonuclease domain-containing protein n=1 Tax=Sphaeroforma arctica JP610 TaxID=667725 RepID=A0A0L0G2Y6_9EUKA|nr:hypothetical protein SARC_04545 [Sphaeroforma arctica JP610]KNC83204.1 hypothetical protein SARC_04545 [Sphaeroforma arctica JP610]|eukprot:XP_014157106.1 hypothetical protein SARC_04545 [Sphaeroforma arctica JP610]